MPYNSSSSSSSSGSSRSSSSGVKVVGTCTLVLPVQMAWGNSLHNRGQGAKAAAAATVWSPNPQKLEALTLLDSRPSYHAAFLSGGKTCLNRCQGGSPPCHSPTAPVLSCTSMTGSRGTPVQCTHPLTLQSLTPPLFSSVPTMLVVADSKLSVTGSLPTPDPLLLLLLCASTPPPRAMVAAAWIAECLMDAIAVRSSICV